MWMPLVAALSCAGAGAQTSPETLARVLLLHPSELMRPNTVAQDEVTRRAIAASVARPVDFYSEGIDAVRASGTDQAGEFVALLRKRYMSAPPDLIVLHGAMHEFIARHRAELWPDTPLLFVAVADYRARDPGFPTDIPTVTIQYDLEGTVALAHRLQPDAGSILLIAGNSDFDRAQIQRAMERLRASGEKLPVEMESGQPMSQLVKRVRELPRNTIVIMQSVLRDASNRWVAGREVAAAISAASAAPVYSYYGLLLGHGVTGGSTDNVAGQEKAIGELARRLIEGESQASLPRVTPTAPACLVDWRQLRRHGLDEDRLPAGCGVLYREPSFWQRYRQQTIAIALVMVLQGALIVALLAQRRRRRAAELESQQHRNELAHAARLATAGQLTASIAHEINQPLTAILTNAQVAEMLLEPGRASREELQEILGDIRRDVERASDVIQRLRDLLRKHQIDLQPMQVNVSIEAVLRLLRNLLQLREVQAIAELAPDLPLVNGDRVHFEQVMLNLAMNSLDAMEQTPAPRRRLTIRSGVDVEGAVLVSVADSGCGIPRERIANVFDPFVSTKQDGMGLGLSIARAIVEAHGGRIWVESDSTGTTFRLTIPPLAQVAR
jgi:C4-dicarboxylate-specific signal transduction histidine kinase